MLEKGNLNKFIDSRIDHYFKNSGFIKLDYQVQLIRDTVKSYIDLNVLRLSTYPIYCNKIIDINFVEKDFEAIGEIQKLLHVNGLNDNSYTKTNKENNKEQYRNVNGVTGSNVISEDYSINADFYSINVVNLDVGMGKTIVGIFSYLIIIECLIELNQLYTKMLNGTGFTTKDVEKLTIKDFKINLAIKNILKEEVKSVFSKLDSDIKYNLVISNTKSSFKGSGAVLYDENKNFTKLYYATAFKAALLSSNYITKENKVSERILNDYFSIEAGIIAKYKEIVETSQLPFFIIDEINDESNFIHKVKVDKQKIKGITGIGLSASDAFSQYYPDAKSVLYFSNFIRKEDILKEIIAKGLYKESGFLYKTLFLENKSKLVEAYTEAIDALNKKLGELTISKSKGIDSNKKVIGVINETIENFLESEKTDETVKNFLENIVQIGKAFQSRGDNSYKETLKKAEELTKKLEVFKKTSFYDKEEIKNFIEEESISYVLEKNSIFVFDNHWPKEKIEEFKTYLKDSGLKVLTGHNYKKGDLTGEQKYALVGTVKEISQGLNLQDFDTLVLVYINQCDFYDIHQSIGRLDRIGKNTDKEVIFVSFYNDDELISKIVDKRKDISVGLSIENTIALKDGVFDSMNKNITSEASMQKEIETIKGYKEDLSIIKEEKILSKEGVKQLKESYELIEGILKEIHKETKNAEQTVFFFNKGENDKVGDNIISSTLDVIQSLAL